MSRALQDVFQVAENAAPEFQDEFVSTEHFLLAMVRSKGKPRRSWSARRDAGEHPPRAPRGARIERVTDQNPEDKFQALRKYAKDLTDLARRRASSTPSSVATRRSGARSRFSAVARRTTRSHRRPGVGKTAIVEGIARRIADGDVPETLATAARRARSRRADRRVEVSRRVRGSLKAVLKEIEDPKGASSVHRRAAHARRRRRGRGCGRRRQPAEARAGARRSALHRRHHGHEYRKHIEKDAALERRFQPVKVGEPTVGRHDLHPARAEGRYEAHHKVRIQDAALVAAATLSHRYVADVSFRTRRST
jgi:ATP-dependent Clp protease ATP-binding subunit ClpB